MPQRSGIGANQPAPGQSYAHSVYLTACLFIAVATMLHGMVVASQKNEVVLNQSLHLPGGGTGPLVLSRPFELHGKVANLALTLEAPILNNWIDYDIDLIDTNSGASVELNSELSYYTGRDTDGVWVEGSQRAETFVPSVRPGNYYLSLTPTAGADQVAVPYTLTIVRDKSYHGNFFAVLGLMLLFPLFLLLRRIIFE